MNTIIEQPLYPTQTIERRSKPRIDCSYPATVQGKDAAGQEFRTDATLTNLSATGLCLAINSEIQPGEDLVVTFRLSRSGPLGNGKAPLIAVDGKIVRCDRRAQDKLIVAMKICHNRFL